MLANKGESGNTAFIFNKIRNHQVYSGGVNGDRSESTGATRICGVRSVIKSMMGDSTWHGLLFSVPTIRLPAERCLKHSYQVNLK